MQKYFVGIWLILISCKEKTELNHSIDEVITTSEFQLIKAHHQQGLLILFPCFSCDAEHTLNEFRITELGVKNGFSVLAMNFNRRLFLSSTEQQALAEQLTQIVQDHSLSEENIVIGGFSSGGNVSLLLCNYLQKNKQPIQPKGVFVVDAPVDLSGLYQTAEKNIKLNFSEAAVHEGTLIKNVLEKELGTPLNHKI